MVPIVKPLTSYPLQPSFGRKRGGPFAMFTRHVADAPPPSETRFYIEQTQKHFAKSYQKGWIRYFKNLKEHPFSAVGVMGISGSLGLLMTSFKRHHRLISSVFLLSLIGYPVYAGVREFPKMNDAYDQVKQGNPKQGEAQFVASLDEAVYKILHVYSKPVFFGAMIAMALATPKKLKEIPLPTLRLTQLRPWVEKLHQVEHLPVGRQVATFYTALVRYGEHLDERFIQPLEKVPVLGWMIRLFEH